MSDSSNIPCTGEISSANRIKNKNLQEMRELYLQLTKRQQLRMLYLVRAHKRGDGHEINTINAVDKEVQV